MAVTVVLTPVLQKAEICRFYQEIGGCYKGTLILKKSVPIRSISFKCILYVLKKHLCEEKKEREIPLALCIRLEYSALYLAQLTTILTTKINSGYRIRKRL